MTTLNFTKMQGLGNDFILLDQIQQQMLLTSSQLQFLANRKYGIGADQILVIQPSTNHNADYDYIIFNADGSEAGHCGNGARCVIQYLYSHYNIISPELRLQLHHQTIVGYKNSTDLISINMGIPQFAPEAIPFIHPYNHNNIYHLNLSDQLIICGVVSVGNPHVAIRLTNISELDDTVHLSYIAQLIQNSSYFPNGVNVNFYVVEANNRLKLRTYERGCGFTLACGTGAVATACYTILQHQVSSSHVEIVMPGGCLTINWNDNVIMTGPAIEVFQGKIELCI